MIEDYEGFCLLDANTTYQFLSLKSLHIMMLVLLFQLLNTGSSDSIQ